MAPTIRIASASSMPAMVGVEQVGGPAPGRVDRLAPSWRQSRLVTPSDVISASARTSPRRRRGRRRSRRCASGRRPSRGRRWRRRPRPRRPGAGGRSRAGTGRSRRWTRRPSTAWRVLSEIHSSLMSSLHARLDLHDLAAAGIDADGASRPRPSRRRIRSSTAPRAGPCSSAACGRARPRGRGRRRCPGAPSPSRASR